MFLKKIIQELRKTLYKSRYFLSYCLAIMIVFHFLGVVIVSGDSMNNTYHNKQILLVKHNIKFDIANNDIVIAKPYSNNKNRAVIKRVIGVPGDTIEINENTLYINGKKTKENYIKEPMQTKDVQITLKKDEYYLLGDNRNNSIDSRVYGPVKKSNIVAKVL